ncbi:MAG: dephospho-CoA kinase [Synechococcus sp.]
MATTPHARNNAQTGANNPPESVCPFARWQGHQRRIGLTGGIASGKSSVAHFLIQKRVPVLDADKYAQAALAPGSAGEGAVLRRYGPQVQNTDGTGVNRAALGSLVFSDPVEQAWLEQQIHPEVRQRIDDALEVHAAAPTVVLMIPLLFEAGFDHLCSEIWVVHCSPAQQRERLMARNHLTAEAADLRIAAQWPLERKQALADHVIWNGGPPETWIPQVDALLQPGAALD